MRVLVTGATGFLGTAVVRQLTSRGWPVLAMGRDPVRLSALAGTGVEAVRLDLAKNEPCPDLGPIDAVVHTAAFSAPWGRRAAFEAANAAGTARALDLARRHGARRFVNIGSPTVCFAFRDRLEVTEDAPLPPPVNAYAATKAAGERLALGATDLSPVALRPRGIYGAGDVSLLPRLIGAARRGPLPLLRDGVAAIDLTHVSDAVRAIEAALEAGPEAGGEVFNVSGGEMLPVRDIVEAAAARAGVPVTWRALPFRPALAAVRAAEAAARFLPGQPEPRVTAYTLGLFAFRQSLSLDKARRVLGWAPQVSLEEGLWRTFEEAPA